MLLHEAWLDTILVSQHVATASQDDVVFRQTVRSQQLVQATDLIILVRGLVLQAWPVGCRCQDSRFSLIRGGSALGEGQGWRGPDRAVCGTPGGRQGQVLPGGALQAGVKGKGQGVNKQGMLDAMYGVTRSTQPSMPVI